MSLSLSFLPFSFSLPPLPFFRLGELDAEREASGLGFFLPGGFLPLRRSSSAFRASSSLRDLSSSRRAAAASSLRVCASFSLSLSTCRAASSSCSLPDHLSSSAICSPSPPSVMAARTSALRSSSCFRSTSTSLMPFSAATAKRRATIAFILAFRCVMSACEGQGKVLSTSGLASAMVFRKVPDMERDLSVFSSTKTPQSFKFSCWCTSVTRARAFCFSKRLAFCGPLTSHSLAM
mmetsp:Transcript_70886/g.182791  ORF Transcript_70886/g.182791 Transcript_70886/m.182791 type:complete len:235 (-) Transcript_70886:928-1632(-)